MVALVASRRFGWLLLALAVLISYAGVYVGLHYPATWRVVLSSASLSGSWWFDPSPSSPRS